MRVELRAPLTERILTRLGPLRGVGMVAWAVVFQPALLFANLARPSSAPYMPEERLWQFFVTWAIVVLLSLWGIRRVYSHMLGLQPLLDELVPSSVGRRDHPFRGVGSAWVPIIFAILGAAVFSGPELVRFPGWWTTGLFLANPIGGLPLVTFLWIYIVLLVGLSRLGRMSLSLRPFQLDRSLGLAPLGVMAFRAFGFFAVISVALAIFGGPDLRAAIFNIALLLLAAVMLFVSLTRLHRQAMTAKTRYVAEAHRLYAQAFAALGQPLSLERLTAGASSLNAAEALERRVAGIQEWPLNEGLIARLAAIVTGLTAAILARVILSRVGL